MKANNTSEEIISCARSLIVAGGYNGFSYADISKVVGVRNATIHHHFPTKSNLVRTLVVNYRWEVQLGMAELERNVPEPVEQLRAYIQYWESCIADGSAPFCVCALLATQLPVLPEEVAHEVSAHFRTLSDWLSLVLERGVANGSIRLTTSAKDEAEVFMATVHGAMLSARAYQDAKIFGVITQPSLQRLLAV
ncbi:MAG: TetR/AcrR family transcriptional regulator [Burkholderiaceae bacterium]|uniref:TetR/AcrR family transcriptional regulator n=1 Tax=Herminiimonas contaminans TaxID=1111140 RepID=A0ABS0ES01_9BURK|nr:TetR/AcrR family transcriptional regulator [Herminiimonas contaminans]MBF8177627.1 TetR/AcrR family transcriptional regulator [Herminiimonas contaminans]MBX9799815.1 TetR/AcrR family transcriptional regulator [Burkholderiaceae bacterium]